MGARQASPARVSLNAALQPRRMEPVPTHTESSLSSCSSCRPLHLSLKVAGGQCLMNEETYVCMPKGPRRVHACAHMLMHAEASADDAVSAGTGGHCRLLMGG